MTDRDQLIREAVEAEAAQAVDSRDVLAALRRGRARRRPRAWVAVAAVATAAAAVAVVVPLAVSRSAAPTEPAAPPAESRTVLLVGVDDGTRTDAVVLARVAANGAVHAVSLPRDAWVDVPGGGKAKLNAVYATAHENATGDRVRAGAEALTGVVGQLTGVHADHYAVVEMSALGRLVDAVGGVEVCLNAAVSDEFSGVDLPAGRHTLHGQDAVAFMRQRRNLPEGDLSRVVRQQVVLRALAGKYLSPDVLGDPARLAALVDVVTAQTRGDEGWDLLDFARGMTPGAPVRAATIPVGAAVSDPEAGFVLPVDPAAVRAFVSAFTSDTPAPGTPGTAPPPSGDGCVD
ncbi:LCP family protein [Actinosynnema sp. NPDC050436]|uniref:LCP family protein n=1 Tax=Actinosynnema sp. NPDC050436 TaxID=3155659 RepID=UPI003401DC7C